MAYKPQLHIVSVDLKSGCGSGAQMRLLQGRQLCRRFLKRARLKLLHLLGHIDERAHNGAHSQG